MNCNRKSASWLTGAKQRGTLYYFSLYFIYFIHWHYSVDIHGWLFSFPIHILDNYSKYSTKLVVSRGGVFFPCLFFETPKSLGWLELFRTKFRI